MKPAEFLDFATWLALQRTTTPPLLRSVISRAYYGSFHLAAEFIESVTHQTRAKHDAHIWLIDSAFVEAHEAGRTCIELARDVQALLQVCAAASPNEVIARRSAAGR